VFAREAEIVPLDRLVLIDSPRSDGEDEDHMRRLAEVATELPPILVHRQTFRVVDGRHRVRTAFAQGRKTINVRFFDGPESDVFTLAVGANVGHGLPLSTADRQAAAARLMVANPAWSDRMVATTAGLAVGSIASIRRRSQIPELPERVGRDGRVRPTDIAKGRRMASEFISRRPSASLREIAKEAGISPATARDVRLRLERGEDCVPAGRSARVSGQVRIGSTLDDAPGGEQRRAPARRSPPAIADPETAVLNLRNDPSLRFTDAGKEFLRWFIPRVTDPLAGADSASRIPPHCKYSVANLARHCASEWQKFAELIEDEAQTTA
jgi:hypothetical protein